MSDRDFEQIVQPLIEKLSDTMDPDNARVFVWRTFTQVWNARGTADRTALADLLIVQPSNICQPVQSALRKLDR